MTALSQPTAIDGYRWLKNDIIRGTYQPDEKLRMSLLTARYALGVGPLREALSQLVAERLVTVVNQKGYRVASMSEAELLDIFDARANMKRCWYAWRLNAAMMRGRRRSWRERICSANWKPAMPVNICSMNGISATRRSIPPLSPGAAPTICYRCANAYLTWRPATALFGYVKPFCPSRGTVANSRW